MSILATDAAATQVAQARRANWERLPAELRDRPQWAYAKPGTKRPLIPGGGPASSTDQKTWCDFDAACQAAFACGGVVGYMQSADDEFTVIDMDAKETTPPERLEDYQRLATAANSYTERSSGGIGFHVWVRATLPEQGCKRDGVEVYDRDRFMICTGDVVVDKAIEPAQQFVEDLVAQMRVSRPEAEPLPSLPEVEEDSVLLARARAAANAAKFCAHFDGHFATIGHSDHSRADMALLAMLAYYTPNNDQLRRLFLASALGKRDKVAKRHDYLARTINEVRKQQASEPPIEIGAEAGDRFIASMPQTQAVTTPLLKSGERKLVGRSLAGVRARAIEWLWTGWIPKGYITIFAGESGAGKSTVLADVAARVTTGRAWPGEPADAWRAPARVLWLGSEDGIEEMTVPRLMACGAELNNVIQIEGVTQQGARGTFSMQDDLAAVGEWLSSAREDGLPFAMLVIDPVTSYLPGQRLRKVDLNDAGQLRTILEPWLVLAQQHHVAIVCVTHFAKDTNRSMMNRVLGSGAFAQTCRSLCAVIEPQATDDYEPEPHEKALIQVKVNLPEHPGGSWRFVTEKIDVATDPRSGHPIAATRPDWLELDASLTAKTAVGPARGPKSQTAGQFAIWVQAQFACVAPGEWLPAASVKFTARRDVGVSESWWNKHSKEYLDRNNVNGTWMCRPVGSHNAGELGKVG